MRILTEFEMALVAGGTKSSEIVVNDPRDHGDPPPDWDEYWDENPPYDGGNDGNPDGAYPSGGPGGAYPSGDGVIAGNQGGGQGVNSLIGPKIEKLSPTGSVIQSNGYVLVDFNGDRVFDIAWRPSPNGGWEVTADGQRWTPDSDQNGPLTVILNPPQ
ncbi:MULTISPECIES: hypothetical protein [unclassified Sphingomonas]|nr:MULTISPECIES: hypothetical protein [unclassified Sphingomonas]